MGGWLCGLCAILLLVFSSSAMEAAYQAAGVFVRGVMPALFPMMIVSRMLSPSKNTERSGRSENRSLLSAVLFSFAAGSPASAQRVRALVDAGSVSKDRLLPLLAATGVMSPMFFVGTLTGWTGMRAACWVMLAAHWLSAVLLGALIMLLAHKNGRRRTSALNTSGRPTDGLSPSACPPTTDAPPPAEPPTLSVAITTSAQAMLAVCGSMMLFSIAAGVLRALLTVVCPNWVAAHKPLLAVVWALLEIGGGSSGVISAYPVPPLCLLCALCSFGGMSICLQNLLFVDKCISPAKLLSLRALHGAISYGICHLLFLCFPSLTAAFAVLPQAGAQTWRLPVLVPALLIILAALVRRRRAFS